MYRPLAKLIILFLTSLTLIGCSGTRTYSSQKELIIKNEIYEQSELLKNNPVNYIINTPANKKFMGIPIKKILYESAHPKPKKQFEDWINKKINRKKKLEKLLSKKQIFALQKYNINFNNWLKNSGEPPAVLDTFKINSSKKRIQQYYKNLGYYNAKVSSDPLYKKTKKSF